MPEAKQPDMLEHRFSMGAQVEDLLVRRETVDRVRSLHSDPEEIQQRERVAIEQLAARCLFGI
jgi:hypothetical protein